MMQLPPHPEAPQLFLLEEGNAAFVQGNTTWTSQKRRAAIKFGAASLFCFLVGILLTSNYAIGTRLIWQLRSQGQRAEATIISKRVAGEDAGEYYVAYRFKTNSNDLVDKEARVSHRVFERTLPGSLQPVVYDPQNPQFCLLENSIGNPAKSAAFVVGWWLTTMAVAVYLASDLRMHHMFSSRGTLLTGTLDSVDRTEGYVESPSNASVVYTFRRPSGEIIRARAKGVTSRSTLSGLDRANLSRHEYHPACVAVLYIADDQYLLL